MSFPKVTLKSCLIVVRVVTLHMPCCCMLLLSVNWRNTAGKHLSKNESKMLLFDKAFRHNNYEVEK